ncbi:DUF1707 domain-containing protein [Blastococcus sp. TF02-09]|uniref:DUF1707 SHOCT-like domain-containing protein n=1 Tax=Blastococcus sp. TF02-09 TaxID=2250576 RepID=UPI000DE9B054|nr:DUF1707 domain-containing protein [Blastococcus sp. TF02-9]RBY75882.1 DUF1707 domain-containing protein [Blastococcus sp. TF02-9]
MTEPHLRAADADRTAVADVLGRHMSAGRLTVAEYEERLGRAWAATTYGELAELTADLPDDRPAPVVAAREARPVRCGAHRWPGADAGAWRSWASTAAIVLAIWAITSLASWQLLYFWPIWVIGPWGAHLLVRSATGRDDRERARPGR